MQRLLRMIVNVSESLNEQPSKPKYTMYNNTHVLENTVMSFQRDMLSRHTRKI